MWRGERAKYVVDVRTKRFGGLKHRGSIEHIELVWCIFTKRLVSTRRTNAYTYSAVCILGTYKNIKATELPAIKCKKTRLTI